MTIEGRAASRGMYTAAFPRLCTAWYRRTVVWHTSHDLIAYWRCIAYKPLTASHTYSHRYSVFSILTFDRVRTAHVCCSSYCTARLRPKRGFSNTAATQQQRRFVELSKKTQATVHSCSPHTCNDVCRVINKTWTPRRTLRVSTAVSTNLPGRR